MKTVGEINIKMKEVYKAVIEWKKNFFEIPKGYTGEKFIQEVTRLLQLYNNKATWEDIAILALHIFIPLMLQKPAAKSKKKEHVRYLSKRLELWKKGQLKELVDEGDEIQKRLQNSKQKELSDLKG